MTYSSDPKRILWVGDRKHPEMLDAWEAITQRGACHHAATIQRAIELSLPGILRVIIARPGRTDQAQGLFDRLLQRYPMARFALVSGSLCDGEQRTGTPWTGCQHIAWHRAAWTLSRWVSSEAPGRTLSIESGLIGIVSRSPIINEGLADSLRAYGHTVANMRLEQLGNIGPMCHVMWDDSLVGDVAMWHRVYSTLANVTGRSITGRAELQTNQELSASEDLAASHDLPMQHHWLVSGPNVRTWQALKQCGFVSLQSKPYDLDSILCALRPESLKQCVEAGS